MKIITKGAIVTGFLAALIITIGFGVKTLFANWPSVETGITTTTATVVPVQLDSDVVFKRNMVVTVKALVTNTGAIRIAESSAKAVSTSTDYFSLYPGESLSLLLENASNLWIGATAGEGVEYITEFD